MNFLKIFLVALAGFILGIVLFHTPPAKAQRETSVTVQRVPLLGIRSILVVEGSQVVGFSCAQRNGQPECYVASVR